MSSSPCSRWPRGYRTCPSWRRQIRRPARRQSHDVERIVMLVSALLALAAQTQFTVTNAVYNGPVKRPPNARLVWRDEFSGRMLDSGKWRNETAFNKKGWFNKEKQYYSAGQNLRVAGGRLVMEARHETPSAAPDWGGQNYTSARIVSTGPGWTYGFYEVRAKLPCARG